MLHIPIREAAVVAVLAASDFKPDQVVCVVGYAHLIGLCISNPDPRLGNSASNARVIIGFRSHSRSTGTAVSGFGFRVRSFATNLVGASHAYESPSTEPETLNPKPETAHSQPLHETYANPIVRVK